MDLETPRLLLRNWKEEDLATFARMNQDPDVMRFFPSVVPAQDSFARARILAQGLADRGWGAWAVELKAERAFIGFIALVEPAFQAHFTPCVEIGWRLDKPYWGQGLAAEGARAALDAAFHRIGLEEVVSFTAGINAPSRRVMEKLGMCHDPSDDFDHPALSPGHPLARHVLYRAARGRWIAARSGLASGGVGNPSDGNPCL
jgi:RimJ/RimL family protein N-acetyltransferase